MLRIEAYPVLDGLSVTVTGVPLKSEPNVDRDRRAVVHRTIPVETIELLGLEPAFRDVITDVMVLYPGLLEYALR